MTVWRPATREIDPLEEAVANAARAAILPTPTINVPPPSSDGIRLQLLRNGRELRLLLSTQYLTLQQRGPRTVVIYAVRGSAVVDKRIGYQVTGQAVLDVATRAFLDVECRLESAGSAML